MRSSILILVGVLAGSVSQAGDELTEPKPSPECTYNRAADQAFISVVNGGHNDALVVFKWQWLVEFEHAAFIRGFYLQRHSHTPETDQLISIGYSVLQQLVQFFHQPLEVGQGRIDRLRLFHIDARAAQEIERPFRAAASQEAEVVV